VKSGILVNVRSARDLFKATDLYTVIGPQGELLPAARTTPLIIGTCFTPDCFARNRAGMQ
jgi:hypothetical protein